MTHWLHPSLGTIPQSTFIGEARSCGACADLDRWAIQEGCRQLARWHSSGHAPPRLGLRLGSATLLQDGLEQSIEQALAENGLTPEQLEIEIPYTLVSRHMAHSRRALGWLAAQGVEVTLGEFHCGEQSLEPFGQLPAKRLKLAAACISAVDSAEPHQRRLRELVATARSMGMEVFADGVMNHEQLTLLREHACDGYLGALAGEACEAGQFAQRHLEPAADN